MSQCVVPVCCSVLQCVVVCCSVLQCVAVCCSVSRYFRSDTYSLCCNVLQLLQCVALQQLKCECFLRYSDTYSLCCNVLQLLQCSDPYSLCCNVLQLLQCVALQQLKCECFRSDKDSLCCSALQCVQTYCSMLHCVAACCSVLQRVAALRMRYIQSHRRKRSDSKELRLRKSPTNFHGSPHASNTFSRQSPRFQKGIHGSKRKSPSLKTVHGKPSNLEIQVFQV